MRFSASAHTLRVVLITWLAMIGVDFFLHAGVLAHIYVKRHPFLLPPERAFTLIPLGYFSFLLLAVLIVWLLLALGIRGWQEGGQWGLRIGGLLWGALVLGLISVADVPLNLMVGWFIGQTVEMGVGGMVAGSGLQRERLRPLFWKTLGFALMLVVVTIMLQSFGIVPTIRAEGG